MFHRESRCSFRFGFTLADLLVLLAGIAVLFALLFPALLTARDAERRRQCENNLKTLALGVMNYQDTYINAMPVGGLNYSSYLQGDEKPTSYGARRINGFVSMLPFLEEVALYEKIVVERCHFNMNQDASDSREKGVGLGPFTEQVALFLCPADEAIERKTDREQGRNNYRMSFGDFPPHSGGFHVFDAGRQVTGYDGNERFDPPTGLDQGQIDSVNRGSFAMQQWNGFHSLSDGTSNTILFSERCFADHPRKIGQGIVVDPVAIRNEYAFQSDRVDDIRHCFTLPGRDTDYPKIDFVLDWSGRRWADGAFPYSGFATVLPPNAASCIAHSSDAAPARAIMTASSYHPGGVNVVFADGATRWIGNKIDWTTDILSGELHAGGEFRLRGPTSFGIWGALGSRSGGESVVYEPEID